MNLQDYLAVARRRWWVVLLGCGLAAAVAWVWTAKMTPTYEGRAVLLINGGQNPSSPTYQDILGSQQLTRTYAELLTSNVYLERISRQLGRPELTVLTLKGKVSAEALPDTQLVAVRAHDPDPRTAVDIATAAATLFSDYVEEAQLAGKSAGAERALDTVFITEVPYLPTKPVSPSLKFNLALGLLTGLVISLLVVAALEYLDDAVDDREDVERLGLSLLASIVRHRRPAGAARDWSPAMIGTAAEPQIAESYRQLQVSIGFAIEATGAKALLVTSALPGEGKSTTSTNLAVALSESSKRVLLIDGDLRRPSIHHYLRLPNSSGLSSAFLANPSVLPSFLKQHPNNRLYVLTSGPIPPNPVEILGSAKMGTLIGLLREHFDVIIVDSPPMLGLADAGLWSTHCDGIVLVARQGRTHQGSLREAAIQASASHKPILGAVINDAKAGRAQAGYYEYTSTGRRRRFSLSNLRGALAPRRTAAQRSR